MPEPVVPVAEEPTEDVAQATAPPAVDFAVRITDDKVMVVLDCADPLADLPLTIERIMACFEDLGLPEFPDRELLGEMLRTGCTPGQDVQDYPLIMGQAPVPSQDGRLEWSKDYFAEGWAVDEESGSIDFWAKLDNRSVMCDELLVRVHEPVEGEAGLSVFNVKIPVDKPAKSRLRLGKGVREEAFPGGTAIYATLNGRVRDTDGTISVDEIYQVKGNVSLATGNVTHSGTVIVEGDVLEGASIETLGDVVVKGMLEPCNIQAGGSLSVGGGIVSETGYQIQVGGDLHARYIHDALIRVEGDVHVVTEITHSDIQARGRVDVAKGRIAGGTTLARKGIFVAEAGAGGSSSTVLIAGVDPSLKPKVKTIRDKIVKMEEARAKINRALDNARMRQDALSPDEEALVAGLKLKAENLKQAIVEAETAVQQITREALREARLEVVMYKEVRSGTTIQLGEQKTVVRSSILKPRIAQRRESRVRILPMGDGNTPED